MKKKVYRGFEVYLVNAQYVKNVLGRKTDVSDCQWIHGLSGLRILDAILAGERKPYHSVCEPVSFNAAFPGACTGNGNTTFDKFIAQLTQHQNAFLWMFAPRQSTLPVGKTRGLGN